MFKRIMLVAVCFIGLISTGCDGVADLSGFGLQQPDYEYEIDTWGSNSEVYEITPKSNPNYTCVFLMLDSGAAMGLQCFPKDTKTNK